MKHPIITSLGLAVLASVSLVTPAFAATIYTVDATGGFGKLDTVTGIYASIADNILGGGEPHCLTSDGVGGFYTEYNYDLYAVNTSGDVSLIDLGGDLVTMYGMDRSSAGTMYGYDYTNDNLGSVDTTTDIWSDIGYSGSSSSSPIGGRLAFQDGILYGAMFYSGGQFGSFDLVTGGFDMIKTDSIYISMVLASDGLTLYGLNGNSLYTLNIDGTVQSELPITGVDAPEWTGASVSVVPEPASMLSTLALVSSGLMLRRRTKQLR
jgi:hypothetical protein